MVSNKEDFLQAVWFPDVGTRCSMSFVVCSFFIVQGCESLRLVCMQSEQRRGPCVYLYCVFSNGTAAAVQCFFRGNITAYALSICIVFFQMEQQPLYCAPLEETVHRCSVYLYCELSDGTAAAVQCSFRGNSTASALSIYIVCIQMEQQLLYRNPFIGIAQHLLCLSVLCAIRWNSRRCTVFFQGNSTASDLSICTVGFKME
jgi:hypothetical protein